MIKRIEPQSKNSNSQIVKGTIQQANERGLKVNDRWFNFSKFLQEKPKLNTGNAVEFLTNGGFITKFISIEETASPTQEEQNTDAILLESLRSAVKIASLVESEVSIKFSTQDIIKLALTLFIQKSAGNL